MKTIIAFFTFFLITIALFAQTFEVDSGHEIPFIENWDTGSFEFNGWQISGDSTWVINNNVGNPEPSAMFDAGMISDNSTDSSTLTSQPLLADSVLAGDIFIDFNLKLSDMNPTGNEKLVLEISNDGGNTW